MITSYLIGLYLILLDCT